MVWTSPMTFTDGRPLTSAQLNTHVRDNLLETEAAKAHVEGGLFVAQSPHSVALRKPRKAGVFTDETTAETDYADLETPGPKVTCMTNTSALCIVGAKLDNSSGSSVYMSVEVSGASSLEAADARALVGPGGSGDVLTASSFWMYEDDLTPGENTFMCKFRTSGGTATISRRRLTVIPF